MSSTATLPDSSLSHVAQAGEALSGASPSGAGPSGAGPSGAGLSGAALHWRSLEGLYASAPINQLFNSTLSIPEEGRASIAFAVDERHYHAAGAAHGTIYFKMLDDAAFYAANTLVTDRFLLTTSFNLHFTRPVRAGLVRAEGRWISGRRRVLVAESRLIDADGEEIGRGTGTFQRSRIALSSLSGYTEALPSGSP